MFELITLASIVVIDVVIINTVDLAVEIIKLPCQLIS